LEKHKCPQIADQKVNRTNSYQKLQNLKISEETNPSNSINPVKVKRRAKPAGHKRAPGRITFSPQAQILPPAISFIHKTVAYHKKKPAQKPR